MASAAAAPYRTCSVSSHPSPAPSSPTPSTSSDRSRKRKREEVITKPNPLLITPPRSEDDDTPVRSRRMPTIPMFASIWESLKNLLGAGTAPQGSSPSGGDGASESPKRVRIDDPSKTDDAAPNDDPNKEPIVSTTQPIQLQSPNKESPRPGTHNNRPSLKIKAPVSTDKQTPPTQLPSPLASSSEDEPETLFKKTVRPVHTLPSTMAAPLAPPFFTRPLRKRSNPEAVLKRVLARRAANGKSSPPRGGYPPVQIALRSGPYDGNTPTYYNRLCRNLERSIPRSQRDRYEQLINSPYTTPEKRRNAVRGRVQKLGAAFSKTPGQSHLSNIELAALLEQLSRDKYTSFQTLEQVEQRRKERNIEIAKLRNASRREIISPLDEKSQARYDEVAAELRDATVPQTKEYYRLDGFPADKVSLSRLLWKSNSVSSNWLNDETMNLYTAMVARRGNPEGGPMRILYFNNAFWTSLVRGSNVSRWATRKKVGGKAMLNLEYLIFPCNHNSLHWTMCVVNFKEKRIENYDSLYSKFTADSVFKLTRQYLRAETQTELDGWTDYNHWNEARQGNGADCGVFSLKSAEVATRGRTCEVAQRDMQLLRQRMVVELVTGTLFPPTFTS